MESTGVGEGSDFEILQKSHFKGVIQDIGLDSDLSGGLFKLNKKRNMRLETEDLTCKIGQKLTFHCQSR